MMCLTPELLLVGCKSQLGLPAVAAQTLPLPTWQYLGHPHACTIPPTFLIVSLSTPLASCRLMQHPRPLPLLPQRRRPQRRARQQRRLPLPRPLRSMPPPLLSRSR